MKYPSIERLLAHDERIAVVGLGYVGLPLAVALAEHFSVIGLDVSTARVDELQRGIDHTLEVPGPQLAQTTAAFTNQAERLGECSVIIVAVPTPIDRHRNPDLTPLRNASRTVGHHMPSGCCVVYESTVYPSATEEVCVPLLEAASGGRLGVDFSVGYSPERINPGDREHGLADIIKVVSGSDGQAAQLLDSLYGQVVTAGIHRASSIKVAEAAKVIENTQRDLNIALMNELAKIFHLIGIDTREVLAAAATKWNFLRFEPGLVGGHCICVDPYYLTFKAKSLGYHPEIILAGRRTNDHMGKYVAERTVKMLIAADKKPLGARVAVLGLTFKENVPDLRNSRVVEIVRELSDYGIAVVVNDPVADPVDVQRRYGIAPTPLSTLAPVDAVVMAVHHRQYIEMGLSGIAGLCGSESPLLIDVKGAFSADEARAQGLGYWRL
jgi:UDP-N-acetyl-D-galactosamine dehydrogenase